MRHNVHLYPLAKPENYRFMNNHFVLHGRYLAIPGCICVDPNDGAIDYNKNLIARLGRPKNTAIKVRLDSLFDRYRDNKRVLNVTKFFSNDNGNDAAIENFTNIEKFLLITYLSTK